ncbi:MAG TPA: glycosyl hydrolase family 28 protein [Tepidisphaeraceae bacterium]|nr:glycosyl hydrolase family 28 protein [Tepidisphaeraceae bacterium]
MKRLGFLLVFLLTGIACAREGGNVAGGYNIRDFSAIGDGRTLDTAAVQKAIDTASAAGGGQVVVPAGVFLIGPIHMASHVDLHLAIGATLKGSPKLADYLGGQIPGPAVKLKVPGRRKGPGHPLCLIGGQDLDDISITGRGTIDGSGGSADFDRGDNDPFRPKILMLVNCRDVRVSDVTLRDSATWVQHYLGCQRVRISGERVYSHANLNNDGLDIDSTDVNVSDCIIDSDDDGICLKSDREAPCSNVTISNCVIGSNCNAIKMGTASRGGFHDITITNCSIRPASEHRQRTWKDTISGLALEMVDGGVMRRVAVANLTMVGVQTPIFIRLSARRQSDIARKSSLGDIAISNITAECDSPNCSSITGIPGSLATDIKLSHILFKCPGQGTREMADRTIPENVRGYPENRMFGPSLPAYGLYLRHVRGLTLEDVQFSLLKEDARPAVVMDDVRETRLSNLDLDAPQENAPAISIVHCQSILIHDCRENGSAGTLIGLSETPKEQVNGHNNESGSKEKGQSSAGR